MNKPLKQSIPERSAEKLSTLGCLKLLGELYAMEIADNKALNRRIAELEADNEALETLAKNALFQSARSFRAK